MRDRTIWRQQIVELLELFGSEQALLEYESRVLHVDITFELISMWFDDEYKPNEIGFNTAFSKKELDALHVFGSFFSESIKSLPASNGTVRTWLASPVWHKVMNMAQETLLKMTPNPSFQRTAFGGR